jgi:hypothetical protein
MASSPITRARQPGAQVRVKIRRSGAIGDRALKYRAPAGVKGGHGHQEWFGGGHGVWGTETEQR